jgi:hypothetical protein
MRHGDCVELRQVARATEVPTSLALRRIAANVKLMRRSALSLEDLNEATNSVPPRT